MLQALANGILYGGTLSIAAVGFSMIFGTLNIINLAHGVFVIGGAYAALVAWSSLGLDPVLVVLPAMLGGFALGWGLERLLIRPAVRRGNPVAAILVTFGFGLVVVNVLTGVFSSSVRNVSPAYAFESLRVFGLSLDLVRVVAFAAALVLITALSLFLAHTEWGRVIRATAQAELGARVCGIDVAGVHSMTFAIGSAFAAASGVLVSMILPFTPAEESQWTVYAFVVVTLGGVGSPAGALLGGLLLGVTAVLTQTYLGPVYTNVVTFLILLVMLLVRPHGILGQAFRASH